MHTSAGRDRPALRDGGKETYSAALSFSSHDDALDFARRSVEKSNDWFAAKRVDLVNRYVNGHFAIVLKFSFHGRPKDYDLVFCAVPEGGIWT
jgi:hypothetical protein